MKIWLPVALVILWITVGCGDPNLSTLDLLERAKTARMSTVVTGSGHVGRPSFRGFLGVGLSPDADGDWARAFDDHPAQAFGFYAYHREPTELVLRAKVRNGVKSKTVTLSVGQTTVTRALTSRLEQMRIVLDEAQVAEGINWVVVQNAKDVEWLSFQALPSRYGRSITSSHAVAPGLSIDGQSVILPFGQSVEFWMPAFTEGQLNLEFQPISDQGAAELHSQEVSLNIRCLSENPVEKRTFQLRGGGTHRLVLPEQPKPFSLTLQAVAPGGGDPLPGQIGLKVEQASLRGSLRQAQPTSPNPPSLRPTPDDSKQRVRPNVLLYVIDTLRADSLEKSLSSLPQLQTFRKEAIEFPNAVAESPWTKPSMASIMTSLKSREHGVLDFNDGLHDAHLTLAEIMGNHGYNTSAIVTNPLVAPPFGFEQGFADFSLLREASAQEVTTAALSWLKTHQSKEPFFLYLHTIDPHLPYSPPSPWRVHESVDSHLQCLDKKSFGRLTNRLLHRKLSGLQPDISLEAQEAVRELYQGEVDFNITEFGRLVSWLESTNLYDNTLIVLTSDHGEELFERGELGHLHSLYEELLSIPLWVKFPRHQSSLVQGTQEICSQIDLLPTILDVVEIPNPISSGGSSLTKLPARGTLRAVVSEVNAGRQAEEAGQSKVDYLEKGVSIREGRWKYHRIDSSGRPTQVRGLFDLSEDPGEQQNLLTRLPVTGLRLETELNRQLHLQTVRLQRKKVPDETTDSVLRSLQYLR